jgi:integrase/recombinase XerD
MKDNRNGQAAALTEAQLDKLLRCAPSPAYRCLWALQRWCASRINETLQLRWASVRGGHVTFRSGTTKTKATKQLRQSERLQQELEQYRQAWAAKYGREPEPEDYLFPGRRPGTPLTGAAADLALRKVTEGLGWVGVSTHSFRRSTAQNLLRQGVPLPVVQQVTGHKSLAGLGEYLKPSSDEVAAALELC